METQLTEPTEKELESIYTKVVEQPLFQTIQNVKGRINGRIGKVQQIQQIRYKTATIMRRFMTINTNSGTVFLKNFLNPMNHRL